MNAEWMQILYRTIHTFCNFTSNDRNGSLEQDDETVSIEVKLFDGLRQEWRVMRT
jgi:hypothetical protein